MSARRDARAAALAAALVLCLPGMIEPAPGAAPLAALGTSPTAPPFKIRSVTGETLELATLLERGPVLLDFWATWCKPCLVALPEIEALHQRYHARGLTVIGISADGPRNYSKVRPFATRLGLSFAIAVDGDESLQHEFHVRALPTRFLIDRRGTIVKAMQGYRPGEGAELEAAVRRLLPADSSAATVDSSTAPR